MALIQLGPLVSNARGPIGGVVFSNNGAGPIARTNTHPRSAGASRPPFDYITHARPRAWRNAQLTVLSAYWLAVLTQVQRDAWDALALTTRFMNKLGEPRLDTGRALFLRANTIATLFATTIFDTAPARAVCEQPYVSVTWNAGDQDFDLAVEAGTLGADSYLLAWVSPARTVTVNTHTHPFYIHSWTDLAAMPTTFEDSAHEPGWRPCMAYFFRFRTMEKFGPISHPVIVRAVSD